MHHRTPAALLSLLLAAGLLSACGKASEVATEKLIEAQAAKEGVQAKVDLQGNQARITTTDAQGQTSQIQAGGAKVSEADLGVPIYPGAQLDDAGAGASRVETPDGTMVMVQLTSSDPADKVAAFYRAQLQPQAQGKAFMDARSGDGGTTLMWVDENAKRSVNIVVSPEDSGSAVHIQATRGKAAP